MKWSYKLGEFFGIDVRLHVTFLLLLAWIGVGTLAGGGSIAETLGSVLFVIAVFGLVVMHEYGHALTARHFGVRTRNITLYPIGGVAMLERMPDRPAHQLLIALAGPAVNFVLAGLLAATLGLTGGALASPYNLTGDLAGALSALFWINVFMGGFNLLPATPMDGGRVLRAALAMRMDSLRATRIATRVARVVAVGMGLAGFHYDRMMLVVIAVFVWFAAGAERMVEERMRRVRRPGLAGLGGPGMGSGAGPSDYQGPVIIEGGPARPGERFVVRVVDGPFGPRLHLTRIG